MSKQKDFEEYDYVTEDNEPKIIDGIAVKNIKKGEILLSYGKILKWNI